MAPERLLLLLLLPTTLERFPARERAEDLLCAPGAIAVEPARVTLPPAFAHGVAGRQAKRMRLPGVPRAIAAFDPLQLPLAVALAERHAPAEVWDLGAGAGAVADLRLDFAAGDEPARRANAPLWARMEALGIESGRLGSERAQVV